MRDWQNKISDHISYTEATKSRVAIENNIDNIPTDEQIFAMIYVAENVFEPIRDELKVPIAVTSFFRSPMLNKRLKGSKTSSHMKGEAIDIDADVFGLITNKNIFDYINSCLDFDQLIWEFGDDKDPAWVHVSSKESGNRNEVLQAYKTKNVWGKLVTKYRRL